MDFLVTVATDFIGIFQKGGEVLASLVTGIVPTLLVLMTAVYAFTALVGEERIDRVIAVSARDGIQYTPLRYIVAPLLAVFFLTNPMAYTQGRWFPEKYNTDGSVTWKCDWAPLHKGVMNLRLLFSSLHAVGYDGWVGIEDFSNEGSVEDRLKNNLAYLKILESETRSELNSAG